jgi:hypothetical protein
MKLAIVFAATVAASVSLSVLAHADDAPVVARAYFESSATHAVVQKAACSFDASSSFDGKQYVFDTHVVGERCSNRAIDEGAVPLFVWLKHGDSDRVVVEALVTPGVDAQKLQTAIVSITSELQKRVRANVSTEPPESIAPAPSHAWTPAATSSWANDYAPRPKFTSPGLMAGGIVLISLGTFATFGGMIGITANTPYGNVGAAPFVLSAGIAGLASGIPMLVVGAKKKTPAVTASVSPMGGHLRVTF